MRMRAGDAAAASTAGGGTTSRTPAPGKRKAVLSKKAQQAAAAVDKDAKAKEKKRNPYVPAVVVDLAGRKRIPLHPEFVWQSPPFEFGPPMPLVSIPPLALHTPRMAPLPPGVRPRVKTEPAGETATTATAATVNGHDDAMVV